MGKLYVLPVVVAAFLKSGLSGKGGRIFALLFAAALMNGSTPPPQYVISGDFEALDDGMVYLKIDGTTVDSVKVHNGRFTFTGTTENPLFASVYSGGGHLADLFVENAEITLYGDTRYPESVRSGGTPANDRYTEYSRLVRRLRAGLPEDGAAGRTEAVIAGYISRIEMELLDENRENVFGAYLYSRRISGGQDKARVEEEISRFSQKMQNHPYIAGMRQHKETESECESTVAVTETHDPVPVPVPDRVPVPVSAPGIAENERVAPTGGAPFDTFIPLSLPDPDGSHITLSSIVEKGGYVLVDFWASWCAPCIGEIPFLKEAYRRYREYGFEIYSVSLDARNSEWLESIDKYGMVWKNVHSSGWGSQAAKMYGITGIPSSFLVSPDGRIIARDLRADALLDKLEEIYDRYNRYKR